MTTPRGGWRPRWPIAVFWTVIAAAFTSAALDVLSPVLLIGPMVGAYLVARYGPRRHLWLTGAPVVPFVAEWVAHGGPWWDALAVAVLFGACLVLGVTVRTRRAYLAALEERARWIDRDREQEALLSAAAERARIARDVHDTVAHNLAVMVALADGAVATADHDRAVDLMSKVAVTGREALAEVRRLVGVLRTDDAVDLRVDALVEQVRAAGLSVALVREGGVRPELDRVAYRIVQEALTNTLKHAGRGATATVRLRYGPTDVDVEVVDDGGGRPTPPVSGGSGLAGIRERAAANGGDVDAGALPGGGWRVRARLPVPP